MLFTTVEFAGTAEETRSRPLSRSKLNSIGRKSHPVYMAWVPFDLAVMRAAART